MCKLSIITPMHNSFQLMKKNLSILEKQDINFFEIIIVDDCSTDNSFLQLKKYAEKSSMNVRLYRNFKNAGPGITRNNGIERASGEYITFIDSDDYFTENFITVVSKYLKKNRDCIIFDYSVVDKQGNNLGAGKSIGCKKIKPGYLSNRDAMVFAYGTTWGKIYRRSIIEKYNVRFGGFWVSEDMPFTKYALAMCEKILYIPDRLYNYVQTEGSLMHDKKYADVRNYQMAYKMLKENLRSSKYKEEIEAIRLREILNNIVQLMVERGDSSFIINDFIKKSYSKLYFQNKYFKDFLNRVKIISYCAYFRCIWALKLIVKYKQWRKA